MPRELTPLASEGIHGYFQKAAKKSGYGDNVFVEEENGNEVSRVVGPDRARRALGHAKTSWVLEKHYE
jgi:hypothetical protein